PGLIREISDEFAVRRPRGAALRHSRSVREVTDITFLGRDGEDLAARFKDGARAGGRQAGTRDAGSHFLKRRSHRRDVAIETDWPLSRSSGFQVIQGDSAQLFVNDGAGTGGSRFDIEAAVGKR